MDEAQYNIEAFVHRWRNMYSTQEVRACDLFSLFTGVGDDDQTYKKVVIDGLSYSKNLIRFGRWLKAYAGLYWRAVRKHHNSTCYRLIVAQPKGVYQRKINLTEHEYRLTLAFVERMRAKESSIMSILSLARAAGLEIELRSDGNIAITQGVLTEGQREAIKAYKPQIVAALKAEKFTGPGYDHSALRTQVEGLYRQASISVEENIAPEDARAAIAELDAFWAEIDEVGFMALTDAQTLWIADHAPRVTALLARCAAERQNLLQGDHLARAVRSVFKGSIKERRKFDASVFSA